MQFHTVTTADRLIEGRGLAVELNGRQIVLFREGGQIYALDNLCPHAGSRLERGRVAGGLIACPMHGAKFRLVDGSCSNPQIGGRRPIVTHLVRIVDGHIEVALSDLPPTSPP